MDPLEAINDDLTAHGHERAGLHRWVKQNEGGQLQVQAGAEIQKGRMVVFTGRFSENGITYTLAGAWDSETQQYTALMEVITGDGETLKRNPSGKHHRLSAILGMLVATAYSEAQPTP